MTVTASTLLSLPIITTGTESGAWGNYVNNGLTSYLDNAIAGTVTLTGDGAVTLSNTAGTDTVTNIVSSLTGAGTVSAQFAIIRVTGTLTTAKVLTAPSSSREYIVVNAATGSTVTIKASGQTGVSVAVGESATVYFNGTDYVKSATTLSGTGTVTSVAASVPAFLSIAGSPITTSGTLAITYSGTALPVANGGTGLTSGTSGGVLYYSATGTLASSTALTQYGIVYGGGAGAAPVATANGTTGQAFIATTGAAPSWGTLGVAGGGTGQTTYTNGQLLIGNTTGNTLTKSTLTAGTGITITNGTGSITIAASGSTSAATPTALGTVYANTNNNTSPYQTFLGYQAGNATTGTANTFIGFQSGLTNTTGSANTAVGYQSLNLNTGLSNTAIGSQALTTNSTGNSNTAIGKSALQSNDTGLSNTAIGASALSNNVSNNYNVAIGQSSLAASAFASDNNTAVGFQSLTSLTTGANNTAFGYQAGYTGTLNLTTGSNNILIGYQAQASAASVSNEFTHGNSSITSNRFWGDFKPGGSSAGTTGQVFTSAGAGASPTWTTPNTSGSSLGLVRALTVNCILP